VTKQETTRILSVISEIYPGFLKGRQPEYILEIWHRVFRETPYGAVDRALADYIAQDTKGFPPAPGTLNGMIRSGLEGEGLRDYEAWDMMQRSLGRRLGCKESGMLPREEGRQRETVRDFAEEPRCAL